MFISDQETATDMLQYEAIARTVVKLIESSPEVPITIGVHGDWGAGKSSVLKMAQASLETKQGALCIWFNGWAFEGFEDAKTVVLETIIEELKRARPKSEKVKAAAKKLLRRVDWLKAAKKAGGLAFTLATGIPTLGQMGDLIGAAKAALGKGASELTREDIEGFAEQATGFLKDAEEESVPAHIHAFREEFLQLLDAAEVKQLVVMVDDLDRCLPSTAIGTLEAIRLFLFVDRTAFVIGADEMMIEYAVREHFPDLPPSSGPVSYARNYLEKLIQVPFRIPALGVAETRTYITLLLVEARLGRQNAGFKELLKKAREDMRQPWLSKGISPRTLQETLGKEDGDAGHDLVLANQITSMLAEGTKGNPRQIKRFLNSMLLRREIGEARGFSTHIGAPVLAKLMLAERFKPDFFDEIAREASAAADGHSARIRILEEQVTAPGLPEKPATDSTKPGTLIRAKPGRAQQVPSDIEDWLKNDWIKTWAALEPTLANADLRPYVFVTRDKRMLSGGSASVTRLDQIVTALMAGPIQAKAAAKETRDLTETAAGEIFDDMRMRILQAESFAKEPAGARGLVELVKIRPELERRLLDFMRELPASKLGAWAAATFGTSFKQPSVVAEYRSLIGSWADQSENSALKAAAAAIATLGGK